MTSSQPLRYGSVPYLNARPLLEGLADEVGELTLTVPSCLAAQLANGELDVALAPVVAGFEQPNLVVVPAGAVVAHGAVGSVLLFSRQPPHQARRVALDASSRTSAALVRVLFRHHWHAEPTYIVRPPDPDLVHADADAVLLIGDPALQAQWDGPPPIDLGAAWAEFTGLPFVFAAWHARNAAVAEQARPALERAAAAGIAALSQIAADGARSLDRSVDDMDHYLRQHLSFSFGEREWEGLRRFGAYWHELLQRPRSV